MRKTGKITRIIAATLLLCMLFALTSCLDAVGGLRVKSYTIDRGSVDTVYYVGQDAKFEDDIKSVKLQVTYSDEAYNTVYTFDELVVTYPEDILAAPGTKDIKVSMLDPNTDEKLEKKFSVTVEEDPNAFKFDRYEVDATDMKTVYNIGETIDFIGVKLYEVWANPTEEKKTEITDLTKVTYEYDEATFTATAGTKQILVKYDGKDAANTIVVRVNNPEVEIVEITSITVGGEYDATYEVGETPDFSGLTVTVTYEGETETVVLTGESLTFGGAVTNSVGKKTVTITFTDPVNNEEATASFQIDVIAQRTMAAQFEKPATITSFESDNKTTGANPSSAGEFFKGGMLYVIGDDNAFVFKPAFAVLVNGVPETPSTFYASVEIAIKDNGEYKALTKTEAGAVSSFYNGETLIAEVNTTKHTYDFTEDAVGSEIKISVLPSENYYKLDNIGNTPVTLEAKIIDAYNVTEAWQLAVIDNYHTEWNTFKEEHGILGYTPAGIVLHRDIHITASDVPEEFFFKTTRDVVYHNALNPEQTKTIPAGTRYLDDNREIYYFFGAGDFVIEGNFFNLSVADFPIIASPVVFGEDADKDYGDDYSNACLFRFDSTEYEWADSPADISEVEINNLALIGNAARDNWVDEQGMLVSAGGLIFLKSADYAVTTMNNTIATSFFITYFPDRPGKMYVNDSKCFDSYQNAAFVYGSATLELKDSYISGSGGPLVIASSCVEDVNDASGTIATDVRQSPNVKITNTVMDTHLTGQELWFSAVGATSLVGQIKAISAGLKQANLGSFVDGSDKMNVKLLLMNAGATADKAIGDVNTEGTVLVDGKGIARWKTEALWNAILNHPAYAASAPFFTVTDGNGMPGFLANPADPASLVPYAIFYDGTTFCDILGNPLTASPFAAQLATVFAAADTLTLSQGGMSIVLDFYH